MGQRMNHHVFTESDYCVPKFIFYPDRAHFVER